MNDANYVRIRGRIVAGSIWYDAGGVIEEATPKASKGHGRAKPVQEPQYKADVQTTRQSYVNKKQVCTECYIPIFAKGPAARALFGLAPVEHEFCGQLTTHDTLLVFQVDSVSLCKGEG